MVDCRLFHRLGCNALGPLCVGSSPDGLERVAEDQGFIDTARDAPYSVIADYVFPGVESEAMATILAGVIGVTIVSTCYWLVAHSWHIGAAANRRV